MRFLEISKPLVTQLLTESVFLESKNTHLEHLEDNIFNKGFAGAKEAVDYLYSLHEMLEGNSKSSVNMTTKWDGAPAIIAGKDPQTGKFFVGTKGVFAKKPKINFTNKDIDVNHADVGDKDGSGLREKLKLALKYLNRLNFDTVVQGDMLFAGQSDIKTITLDDKEHLVFKPNTITYAVPKDSEIGKQISNAGFGIVWHTEYVGGPTLADTEAKFGFDSSVLGQANGVYHRDAIIRDLSGTVTLTKDESSNIMSAIQQADSYLKSIDAETFAWLEKGTDLIGKDFLQQLKAHVNNNVRAGQFDEPTKFAQGFVQKYIDFMTKEIEKVKTQKSIDAKTEKMVQGVKFIKEHVPGIVAVYDLYLKIIEAKVRLVKKLEQIRQIDTFVETEDGFEVTGEEGFVAVDRLGNALKLVDRLEFSRLNFGSGRPGA
tara:strand:- start:6732 stop:8018 length:1287 start_codon:yes stop_codon:yes gene_type:complete